LVILGDLVLDVGEFMKYYHPGGRFVLTNNIGQDISLSFYGVSCNDGQASDVTHMHSQIAKMIANDLVVAMF